MAKNTVEATDQNFEQLVIKSDKPVLVDFWAQWCGPCIAIAPALEELAAEYKDRFVIAKLDIDTHAVTTDKYGIRNIPTLLFFKNGQIVDKQVGAGSKADLKKKIEAVIA